MRFKNDTPGYRPVFKMLDIYKPQAFLQLRIGVALGLQCLGQAHHLGGFRGARLPRRDDGDAFQYLDPPRDAVQRQRDAPLQLLQILHGFPFVLHLPARESAFACGGPILAQSPSRILPTIPNAASVRLICRQTLV